MLSQISAIAATRLPTCAGEAALGVTRADLNEEGVRVRGEDERGEVRVDEVCGPVEQRGHLGHRPLVPALQALPSQRLVRTQPLHHQPQHRLGLCNRQPPQLGHNAALVHSRSQALSQLSAL